MRTILALCAVLAVGCAHPQPIVVPTPPPARVARPALRIKALPPTSTETDVLKAYVLDLADQVGYADQLEILIWGKP